MSDESIRRSDEARAEKSETSDEAIVSEAVALFVRQVTDGKFFEANQAAAIAFATARLVEDEDPLARGRW